MVNISNKNRFRIHITTNVRVFIKQICLVWHQLVIYISARSRKTDMNFITGWRKL